MAELVKLRPERVFRLYRGGSGIGRLRGEREADGDHPEDWLGSVTEATGPGQQGERPGLSRTVDGAVLADLVTADPEGWLGRRHLEAFGVTPGVLVKLLDSGERLPVHAHPDRAFAQRHLGSFFGKTEAWLVLATRGESADVWVGLREAVAEAELARWVERQETARMLDALNRVSVRAGDVVYVPGGTLHAIGEGLLVLELQEPTDFAVFCEYAGFPVEPEEAHMGRGWELMLRSLVLDASDPVLALPDEARVFFWADSRLEPAERFAVLLVTEGSGSLNGIGARRGDAFALPASLERLDVAGDLAGTRVLAPDPPAY